MIAAARALCFALAVGLAGGCAESPCGGSVRVTVLRCHDGDTCTVDPAILLPDGTRTDTIRLLCIDAPESGEECYDDEATVWLTDRIVGKEVRLSFEDDCSDEYGRALTYIWISGHQVNRQMVRQGYATLIQPPFSDYEGCESISRAQDAAIAHARGGWATCSGLPWAEARQRAEEQ